MNTTRIPAKDAMTVPLSSLVADTRNARRHPKKNLDAIRESLDRFGQVEPLVVQQSTMRVLGGNGRLQVLRETGAAEVSVVMLELDDVAADELALRLNRAGELATWDAAQLGANLGALSPLDLPSLGWDAGELRQLTETAWVPTALPSGKIQRKSEVEWRAIVVVAGPVEKASEARSALDRVAGDVGAVLLCD